MAYKRLYQEIIVFKRKQKEIYSLGYFNLNLIIGYLMSESNSKNLEVPSCTGGIPGACCNHPISSEEPRKVFHTRDVILIMPIIINYHFIAVFSNTMTKKVSMLLLFFFWGG